MSRLLHFLLALAQLSHLFAVLVVAGTSGIFAWLALGGGPVRSDVWRVVAAMFFLQISIGLANEFADRDLDAIGKPWRPIPAGVVAAHVAVTMALIAALSGLLISLSLGLISALLALLGLSIGLAYDFWLKRGPFAWLAYALAVPLIAIWSFASVGKPVDGLLWLYPIGILPVLAVHLANSLPDIESDARAGLHGIASTLGRRRALSLCRVSFIMTPFLIMLASGLVPTRLGVLLPSVAMYAGLVLAGFALAKRGGADDRWLFHLCAPAIAILGVGWVAATMP